MSSRWAFRGAAVALLAFLALVPGAGPARGAGEAKPPSSKAVGDPKAAPPQAKSDPKAGPPPSVTDADIYQGEFSRAGAFKFYDNTEDLLRTGQFEMSYARYLFLKTHIRGQALYTGLAAMVDQRLRFLSAQLRLGEGRTPSGPYRRVTKRKKPKSKPVCPPPADQKGAQPLAPPPGTPTTPPKPLEAAPPGEPKAPEAAPPAPTPGEKEGTPAKAEPEPPPGEAKEETTKAEEPAPPLTFWQKLKRKAMFWKKD